MPVRQLETSKIKFWQIYTIVSSAARRQLWAWHRPPTKT